MKVGIPLFLLRHEQLVPIAEVAEEVGLESVWMPEHLVFPAEIRSRYPYAVDGVAPIRPETPLLDPLLVLAQIAARTSRLRLGTNVYVLPLRHPLATARLATTLDVLSGGRVSVGVGVGGREEDYKAAEAPFEKRMARITASPASWPWRRALTIRRQARPVAAGRSRGAVPNGMPKRSRNSMCHCVIFSPV